MQRTTPTKVNNAELQHSSANANNDLAPTTDNDDYALLYDNLGVDIDPKTLITDVYFPFR